MPPEDEASGSNPLGRIYLQNVPSIVPSIRRLESTGFQPPNCIPQVLLGEVIVHRGEHRRAFYWNADDGFVDVHALGGFEEPESIAASINDAGEVAVATVSGGQFRAYVWSREHGARALPALGPGSTYAHAVNNAGVVVGSSGNSAVIWTPLMVGGLIDYLDDIAAGLAETTPGVNGVLAKLRSIQAHIAGNRITAARNQIAALITQLEDMVADGSLTAEQGAHLIELAQALLASL
jgi:hypothetical protein